MPCFCCHAMNSRGDANEAEYSRPCTPLSFCSSWGRGEPVGSCESCVNAPSPHCSFDACWRINKSESSPYTLQYERLRSPSLLSYRAPWRPRKASGAGVGQRAQPYVLSHSATSLTDSKRRPSRAIFVCIMHTGTRSRFINTSLVCVSHQDP